MYFNLIPLETDIDSLIDEQNEAVIKKDAEAQIQMWAEEFEYRPVIFREIYYCNDNYTEFTAFVSHERFYAFLVSASSNSNADQNLSRLRYVIKNAIFVVMHGVDPENSDSHWSFFFGVPDEQSPDGVIVTLL